MCGYLIVSRLRVACCFRTARYRPGVIKVPVEIGMFPPRCVVPASCLPAGQVRACPRLAYLFPASRHTHLTPHTHTTDWGTRSRDYLLELHPGCHTRPLESRPSRGTSPQSELRARILLFSRNAQKNSASSLRLALHWQSDWVRNLLRKLKDLRPSPLTGSYKNPTLYL